ncbi:MAG TPA: cache domain-containing protein, partial [Thermodesulfovibrionales bacterium]|nr:cache domain-containing protein [Thermodesulfovibrionales bacterium]
MRQTLRGYGVVVAMFMVGIVALVSLNIFYQRSLKMEMAEQFNHQQLLLAKTEALRIESYLNVVKEDLLHFVQIASMINLPREADFRIITDSVCRHIGDIKRRVVFLDAQGAVRFTRGTMPIQETDDRIFLMAVKDGCQNDVRIHQDAKRVYLTAPICRSNSLYGAMVIFLDIQDVSTLFLSPLKSGERGYAWMMDDSGNLLYHPTQPDMVGKNLYKTDSSCFRCHRSFDVEKKIIEGRGDFQGRYIAPSGEDKILAFSTTSVGDAKWIVAVSAPYSEVTRLIGKSTKVYSLFIMFSILAMCFTSVILIIFFRKKVKAEELEKRKKVLEEYAGELEHKVDVRTKELSTEKEKLHTVVSALGSGLILLDAQGRIQWINQTMKDIAGRDISGMACEDICSDYTVVGSYEEHGLQTEIISNLFGRSDRYYQMTTAPVKAQDGSIDGYIKLLQDVTEMKRAEEQMVHAEKLSSLERLTSGIAQEIGNPLTSVFSFVQMLREVEHDELKKETIETIYFHMNRIAGILKQLSSFSKMPPPELKPARVNNLIEDSLSLIQYDKRVQDITIVKDLSSAIPEITTDSSQLRQVFVNVILNAADAMPHGGTLTIRSRGK